VGRSLDDLIVLSDAQAFTVDRLVSITGMTRAEVITRALVHMLADNVPGELIKTLTRD
jgi:hypothetical protein